MLAGLALAGLAGACEAGTPAPAPDPASPTPPPPDALLAELVDERSLLATYDRAIARHPALRARLAGPRADHAEHVGALERLLTAPPSASPVPVGVPGTTAGALAALRSAERAASNARASAALTASADRAGVLASIAASEATHGLVLR